MAETVQEIKELIKEQHEFTKQQFPLAKRTLTFQGKKIIAINGELIAEENGKNKYVDKD